MQTQRRLKSRLHFGYASAGGLVDWDNFAQCDAVNYLKVRTAKYA